MSYPFSKEYIISEIAGYLANDCKLIEPHHAHDLAHELSERVGCIKTLPMAFHTLQEVYQRLKCMPEEPGAADLKQLSTLIDDAIHAIARGGR